MASNENRIAGDRRVLITGATGFIGSWIVKQFIERGEQPWVYDLDVEPRRLRVLLDEDQLSRVHFIRGDILSFDDLERAVADHGVTHIIHLAALQVPACAANPLLGARVNVIGTLNVFEIARRRRDTVRRVVYASSAAVYGPEEKYEGKTIPEGAPPTPLTHYGVFKQANEGSARIYAQTDGISSAALRPGTVYGAGRDQGMTSGPTKAIKATVAGRPYAIRFTGGFDMQYARDTAELFLRAAEATIPGAKVYTLRGAVVQMDEFLNALASVLPDSKRLIQAAGPQLPVAFDFDDSAIARDLGDPPRTPLEQGVRETAEIFERQLRAGTLDTRDLDV